MPRRSIPWEFDLLYAEEEKQIRSLIKPFILLYRLNTLNKYHVNHEGVLIFQQTKIFHLNYLLEPFNQNAHGNSFETFAMHYSRENPERFKTRPTIQLVNSPQ